MFGFDTTAAGMFVPHSKWHIEDIPDLSGKVAIVTGANTGLGKATSQHLLEKGAKVYAACRSESKAQEAIAEIKKNTGKDDIHFLHLDLGDIKQSTQAGKDFTQKEQYLDILVNSAGVMFPPHASKTSDGYELQFGTNVLGHFAFTKPLLPLLTSTAQIRPEGSVRVVWLSSSGHYLLCPKDGIDYQSITDVERVNNKSHYGQSKLGDIHLSNVLARKMKNDKVVHVSLHPGNISTDLARHNWLIRNIIPLNPVSLGCLTQLYCATSPEITLEDTGSYYVPWARKYHTSHSKANDPIAEQETWDFCEAQIAQVLGS